MKLKDIKLEGLFGKRKGSIGSGEGIQERIMG
jgi:hypothetical protein